MECPNQPVNLEPSSGWCEMAKATGHGQDDERDHSERLRVMPCSSTLRIQVST